MSKKQHGHASTTGKICHCRKPSSLLAAAKAHEKREKYNLLAFIAREATKEILKNNDKGKIATMQIMVEVETYDEKQPAYVIFEEFGYCIAWTINGVAELRDGIFTRYIEFNDAHITGPEVQIHQCYCEGHMVDFITLADICKSIIENRALEFGISEKTVEDWKEKAGNCFELAELLKQAI